MCGLQEIIYATDDQYFAGRGDPAKPTDSARNLGLDLLRDVIGEYQIRPDRIRELRTDSGDARGAVHAKVQAWCRAWEAWHKPHHTPQQGTLAETPSSRG